LKVSAYCAKVSAFRAKVSAFRAKVSGNYHFCALVPPFVRNPDGRLFKKMWLNVNNCRTNVWLFHFFLVILHVEKELLKYFEIKQ